MTETDFIKIVDAKNVLKGSFKGTIIHVGDLKSGTTNGKDWTKKIFIIQDDSADAELVCWGAAEIEKFKMGCVYEFVNPWWKIYEGKVSVQLGKYCNVKVVGSTNTGGSSPAPEVKADNVKVSDGRESEPTPPVKCPHGKAEQKGYICKKCVATLIMGYVADLEKARVALEQS